jgi:hypothetical protein
MHARSHPGVSTAVTWVALVTVLTLAVPAVAMRFTDEVNWGPLDFALMGALVFGAGLTFVLLARRTHNAAYRMGVALAVVAGVLLVWVGLAVGFVGAEDHPANLLYAAVLSTAGVGAVIARFRARGLAIAMFAAAGVHAAVTVVALVAYPASSGAGAGRLMAANAVFIALFAGSGVLFRRAARAA